MTANFGTTDFTRQDLTVPKCSVLAGWRKTGETKVYSIEEKRDYTRRVDYRIVDAPDVASVAVDVWNAFGLRDVARVDVRRDRDGVPNFVEVNPLPGLNPETSDLVILARLAGTPYDELIRAILQAAFTRYGL